MLRRANAARLELSEHSLLTGLLTNDRGRGRTRRYREPQPRELLVR